MKSEVCFPGKSENKPAWRDYYGEVSMDLATAKEG